MQNDEIEIIRDCINGNVERFAVLVDRYKTMAYTIAYRMLGDPDSAQDAAQEAFIAAFNALSHFRAKAKFSTWLVSIVLNRCKDMLRAGVHTVSMDEISGSEASVLPTPEALAYCNQQTDALQQALNRLPAEYREIIILKHIEEMDYTEISEILGVGINALKVRAYRARELLRDMLKEKVAS